MTEEITETTEEVVVEPEQENVPMSEKNPEMIIRATRVQDLTDAERKYLIDSAKKGIEDPVFEIKPFKNGNVRICKRKKPSLTSQMMASNGETTIKTKTGDQKVYMTDNQLLWQHVMDLQDKYSKLYHKHKKLKLKYNDLYIEDDVEQPPVQQQQPQQQQPQQQQPQQQIPTMHISNWRTALLQK